MESQFDRLLIQPTRFGVVAFLVSRTGMAATFVETCRAAGIRHSGAMSAHARALESAGYLIQQKCFVDRKPQTALVLTNEGREAFTRHLACLNALTEDVRKLVVGTPRAEAC